MKGASEETPQIKPSFSWDQNILRARKTQMSQGNGIYKTNLKIK